MPFDPKTVQITSMDVNSAGASSETHYYTITLQNATVGTARSMTEGRGAFTGPAHGGMRPAAHEAVHLVQQSTKAKSEIGHEELTISFEHIERHGAHAPAPAMVLKASVGQTVSVQKHGRRVLSGRLKSVQSAGPKGDKLTLVLSGARRG